MTRAAGSRAASQVQVAVDDDVLDYFVLLGSPADILAGYTALTGWAPVPPDWSFGWWQSRCSHGSAEEALETVREMREAGFPLDVIYLDIGIHFVRGYTGPVHVIDWTNLEVVRVMAEEYGRLFATGASVVKVDFGEELPEQAVYADGTPAERMRNLYLLRYQETVHAATAAARGKRERLAWSRSGWAGPQRLPVRWGGDVPAAREMLLPELAVPLDGREAAIRYATGADRHRVEVEGHPGEVVVDASAGVELRR